MNINYNFWNQWSILILVWVAITFAYYNGALDYVLTADKTYITLGILATFNICAVSSLIFTYMKKIPAWAAKQLDFIAAHLTAIGMVGTVIGLIIIVRDGIPDPQHLLAGVGTALTTTLAGLVATVLLNQMLVIMDGAVDET